jgi:outer membrane immunogenic protein
MPISSFARAADLGGKAPHEPVWEPQVSSYSSPAIWSGAYAGLSGGYGWGQSEQLYVRQGNHGYSSTSPSGPLAALTLGYNYDVGGGWIAGIEGDLGLLDISADDKQVYDGHIYKTHFGPWWGTVRGRAGYAFDRTLVYGTAGAAFMAVDEISIGNTPGETAKNADTRSGWVVGAGIEHAFAPNAAVKIEYLHMDFGRYEGLSANVENFHFDNSVDLVRAGVNYKF